MSSVAIQQHSNQKLNRHFFKLYASHFLVDTYAGFMTPLLPMLTIKFGLTTGIIGTFIAVSALSSSILQPLYGSLMDRFPKINFALIGIIMASLIALIGNVQYLWLLMTVVFISYMGNGMYHPFTMTQTATLARSGEKNGRMSMFFSIGTLGFAFGPILSSQLVEAGGLPMTLWAGLMLMAGVPLLWKLEDTSEIEVIKAPKAKKEPVKTISTPAKFRWPFKGYESKILSLLCFIGFVRFFTIVGLQTYMPFIWTEQGYNLSTIGAVLGCSTLMGVPMVIYAGKLADKIGEKYLHLMTIIPGLILSVLLFQTSGFVAFGIFIALIGCMFASQATNVIIALRYIKHSKNLVSGILNGITIGAAGIGMPLVGYLGDQIGLSQTFQLLLPPIITLGLVASVFLPSPKRFRKPLSFLFNTLFNKKPAYN